MTRRQPAVLRAVLVLSLLGGIARPALAVDDENLAREKYKTATRYFDLGKYREAAKEFEAAYEAKDAPALLYNIAQSYRLAGENVDAVRAYRSFLRRTPRSSRGEAKMRIAEVEEHIANLQKLLAQQTKAQQVGTTGIIPAAADPDRSAPGSTSPASAHPTSDDPEGRSPASSSTANARTTPGAKSATGRSSPPVTPLTPPRSSLTPEGEPQSARPAPPPAPAEVAAPETTAVPGNDDAPRPAVRSGSRGLLIGGVVLAGLGAAALAAGIAFGVQAKSAGDQISDPAPGTVFDPQLEASGQRDQALAIALLAGGGAVAATGIVLAIVGAHRSATSGKASREHASTRARVIGVGPVFTPSGAGAAVHVAF